jgi:hypothetical protein
MTESHLWAKPGIEPPLAELLSDPITQAVMAVDGVKVHEVLAIIDRVQARVSTFEPVRPFLIQAPPRCAEET